MFMPKLGKSINLKHDTWNENRDVKRRNKKKKDLSKENDIIWKPGKIWRIKLNVTLLD